MQARKQRTYSKNVFKPITAFNEEQKEYIKLIHNNDIIICTGKAGTGKTAIASAIGAEYLISYQRVERIVLSRPIIGSEDLGYLPGDAAKKIGPYLMPLFTELGTFCDVKKLIEQDKVWIHPLAYMRGCTYKDSFIILDEAQNCDIVLLKLALTRLGENSKMIITGDLTQSDLSGKKSKDFGKVINEIIKPLATPENRIALINLTKSVRHQLVELISNQFETCGV